MSSDVETQLGHELAARLGVVALFPADMARSVVDETRLSARHWADQLTNPTVGADKAADVYTALWPKGAPVEWWLTPLGRSLFGLGVAPDQPVSVRTAAELLGWTRYRVRNDLGPAPLPLKTVLAHL